MERTPKKGYLLRLPASIRLHANELAEADGISLNQFITLAVAERIAKLRLSTPRMIDPDEEEGGESAA